MLQAPQLHAGGGGGGAWQVVPEQLFEQQSPLTLQVPPLAVHAGGGGGEPPQAALGTHRLFVAQPGGLVLRIWRISVGKQPAMPQPSSVQLPKVQVWQAPPLHAKPLQQSVETPQLLPLGLQHTLPVQLMLVLQQGAAPHPLLPVATHGGQSWGQVALVSVPLGSQQPSGQTAGQSCGQVQLVSPGSHAPLGQDGGGAEQSPAQVCQVSVPLQQPSPQAAVGQSPGQVQFVSLPLHVPSPQHGEQSAQLPQVSPGSQRPSPQQGDQSRVHVWQVSRPLRRPSPQQANASNASRNCCQWSARIGVTVPWIGSNVGKGTVPVNEGAA